MWLLVFGVAGDMFDCVWIWYCCCNMSLRRVSGLLFWWFGFLVAVGFMFACIGGLCRFGFVFWLFGFGRRLVVALWQVVGGGFLFAAVCFWWVGVCGAWTLGYELIVYGFLLVLVVCGVCFVVGW